MSGGWRRFKRLREREKRDRRQKPREDLLLYFIPTFLATHQQQNWSES
jgi:hypothetical protein